jgi:ankyrin repeat protein
MIQMLLKAGANANAVLPSGETVLMTASRTGSVEGVKALIAAGANVNAKENVRGQTALMWAVAERHVAVAQALVESGANVRERSESGFTPLLVAARAGDRDLARLFLSRGADVNETASDGAAPLVVATVRGHVALAEWLLDQGADPNAAGAGYTALHWATGTWDTMSTHEYQVETGEWSALAGIPDRAAKLGFIKALLDHGANINARVVRNPPRFGYSLGGGSIIGGGSMAGGTPFFLAAMVGDIDLMRYLLAQGADPLLTTNDGTTPLMATAGISVVEAETSTTESKLLEALKLMLELGGNIRSANEAGTTALHATTYVGFNVIAQFLVDHGAELNAKNRKGETPLKIANGIPMSGMFYSQPKTAALLKKLGATE